eukprot:35117-Amorphochlora_amoeboformis.AAC.1
MEKLSGAVHEPPAIHFEKKAYIQTKLGNKISKRSILYGSAKIRVLGKTIVEPGVIIRGDLATVDLGKNCVICQNSVLRPPDQRLRGHRIFVPLKIGDHCIIEKGRLYKISVIQAAKIADFVQIGENCVIGKRCMISSCVMIQDGTVVPSKTPYSTISLYFSHPRPLISFLSRLFFPFSLSSPFPSTLLPQPLFL